ncbi:MAG: ATP-binding protein [Chloroflexi bacterium]|nr:ATP-binding protein [Chloroflexota bacterium]
MTIVKNTQINFNNENFCTNIYGLPGAGKTTLAFSAPGTLLIGFDKGVKRIKPEHRTDIISINSYQELLNDVKTLQFKQYQNS